MILTKIQSKEGDLQKNCKAKRIQWLRFKWIRNDYITISHFVYII